MSDKDDVKPPGWHERYDKLKPELRQKFDEVRAYVTDETLNVFSNRHLIGKLMIDLNNDDEKYGKKVVGKFESLLGLGKDYLNNARLFAERYSNTKLNELMVARTTNGDPLVWSHVVELIRIPNLNDMFAMQSKVVDECLTAAELRKQVQGMKGGKKSKGGRPALKPNSMDGVIDQFESMAVRLLNISEQVWFSDGSVLSTFVDTVSQDELTPAFLNKLSGAMTKGQKLQLALAQFIRDLSRMKDRLSDKGSGDDMEIRPADELPTRKRGRPAKVLR